MAAITLRRFVAIVRLHTHRPAPLAESSDLRYPRPMPLGLLSAFLWDLRAQCEAQVRALTDAQRQLDLFATASARNSRGGRSGCADRRCRARTRGEPQRA